VLTEGDKETLLQKEMQLEDYQLADTAIFAQSYLDRCQQAFREPLTNKILEKPYKLLEQEAPETTLTGKDAKQPSKKALTG